MAFFISIIVYLLILTGIGIWKSRQVKSEEDFAVAGRTLSPWVMVCTMLAVWIGTGSIVANAEQTYDTGMAALVLPVGGFVGMILLSLIARRVREVRASSVPEIIGLRFGQGARFLAVIALIMAYMVIVSYQFNAGGAVIEVITGDREAVAMQVGDQLTYDQIRKGRLRYVADEEWTGRATIDLHTAGTATEPRSVPFEIDVATPDGIIATQQAIGEGVNHLAIKQGHYARLIPTTGSLVETDYRVATLPERGRLELVEPVITAGKATIIAAVFIIAYTMLAGLMSLAYADIVTGTIIMLSMLIAFPLYWSQAGGFEGMSEAFAAMGDKPQHTTFWGVYSGAQYVNYLLPAFLLLLGDANQYQRIFASRNAKGAKNAVTVMIFASVTVEILIVASAWAASSMTPDPENGRYILIYAAAHYMPLVLGCIFMVTVVGIIVSTADSFLLVPATVFIKDVYRNYINPAANEKRVVFLSRMMVLLFGIIAYLVSLAFAESTGFFEKALYAYTIYGASITPSLVAALVWRKATKAGAITSILSGTVVTLLWEEIDAVRGALPGWAHGLDAVLPAITVSVLCLVIVSLLTHRDETQSAT